jgi:hypothetical protein
MLPKLGKGNEQRGSEGRKEKKSLKTTASAACGLIIVSPCGGFALASPKTPNFCSSSIISSIISEGPKSHVLLELAISYASSAVIRMATKASTLPRSSASSCTSALATIHSKHEDQPLALTPRRLQ